MTEFKLYSNDFLFSDEFDKALAQEDGLSVIKKIKIIENQINKFTFCAVYHATEPSELPSTAGIEKHAKHIASTWRPLRTKIEFSQSESEQHVYIRFIGKNLQIKADSRDWCQLEDSMLFSLLEHEDQYYDSRLASVEEKLTKICGEDFYKDHFDSVLRALGLNELDNDEFVQQIKSLTGTIYPAVEQLLDRVPGKRARFEKISRTI